MKSSFSLFKRNAWVLTMLVFLGFSSNVFAMDAAVLATIQSEIATIETTEGWDEQIYLMNDLLDNNESGTLDAPTQKKLFDLINAIFNKRIAAYKTSDPIIPEFNLMLVNAQRSSLLADAQRSTLTNYLQMISVEQIIVGNQTETNFVTKVNNVGTALGSAGSNTFDPLIQGFFYQQLSGLYTSRTTQTNGLERLYRAFMTAKTSPLVADSNKADITAKSDVLSIESSLRKIGNDPVFSSKVPALTALQNQPGKTFEAYTQNLNFMIIIDLASAKITSRTAQEITALVGLLTSASTSALLNATQQAQVKEMLGMLSTIKQVQDILAIPDYATRMAALQKFMADNANKTLPDDVQKMLQNAIQDLVDKRPTNDPVALANLANFLGGIGSTTLLPDTFKGQITGTLIPAVNTDKTKAEQTKQLQDILAIPDPAARIAALQKFAADAQASGLPLDPSVQKLLQDGVQTLVNNPSTDPAVLGSLTGLLKTLGNSPVISQDFKNTITSSSLPAVTAAQDKAAQTKQLQDILAIPDPAARIAALQKFATDAQASGLPLDPSVQKLLQDGVQTLVSNPSTDPAVLGGLTGLLKTLGNSPVISQDFKNTITNSSLPAVTAAQDKAAQTKQLQDILAISDPAARIAALQKFAADAQASGLPLDPSVQKLLQDGVQTLVNNPSTDPAVLGGLTGLLKTLGNSPVISQDFKNTITNSSLPAVTAAQDKAGQTKQLQDILAIPDYNTRMAALQKFMADNAGKTLSPEQQTLLQKGMQDLIDKRPTNDPAALTTLSNLLGGVASSTLLPDGIKSQLVGAGLTAVDADKTKAQAEAGLPDPVTGLTKGAAAALPTNLNDILAITDPATRIAALQKFMADNAGKTLPADQQALLQKGLQALTTPPLPTDPKALAGLSKLLTNAGTSTLVSPEFKAQSLNPTIRASVDAAAAGSSSGLPGSSGPGLAAGGTGLLGGELPDPVTGLPKGIAAALPTNLNDILAIPDYKTRTAALQKFMADNAGKTLPADQQALLQKGLQDLITNRPTNDPTALTSLSDLLNKAGTSSLLPADFKNQSLSPSILAAVGADTAKALPTNLNDILAIPDYRTRMAALQKFMADNAGKTLPADQQALLEKGLKDLVANRPTNDPTTLAGLANLLTTAGGSSLLPANLRGELTGPALSVINAERAQAISKGLPDPITGLDPIVAAGLPTNLNDILAIPDYKTRMAALQKFMADNAGKTLPADQQALLQRGLQDLVANRPTNDPAALTTLTGLLGSVGNTTLLPADIKAQLGGASLAQVNGDQAKALPANLGDIQNIPDYKARMAALQKFAAANAGQPFNQAFQSSIQNLISNRPLNDVAGLTSLNNLLGSIISSTLLSPAFRGHLSSVTIPAINGDIAEARGLSEQGFLPDPISGKSGSVTTLQKPGLTTLIGTQNSSGITTLPDYLILGKTPSTGATTLIGMPTAGSILGSSTGLGATPGMPSSIGSSSAAGQNNQFGTLGSSSGLPGLTGSSDLTGMPGASGTQGGSGLGRLGGFNAAGGLKGSSDLARMPGASGTQGGSGLGRLGGFNAAGGLKGSSDLTGMPGASGSESGSGLGRLGGFNAAGGLKGSSDLAGMPGASGTQSGSGLGRLGGFNAAGGLKGSSDLTGMPGASGTQSGSGLGRLGGFNAAGGLKGSSDLTGMPGASGTQGGSGLGRLGGFNAAGGLKGSSDLTGMPGAYGTESGSGLGRLGGFNAAGGLQGASDLTGMPGALGTQGGTLGTAGGTSALGTGLKNPSDLTGMPGTVAGELFQAALAKANAQPGAAQPSDETEKALIKEIEIAMTQPTLEARMLAINAVLVKAGDRIFTGALQNAYATAIQHLFDERNGNQAAQRKAKSKTRKEKIRATASSKNAKSRKTKATSKTKAASNTKGKKKAKKGKKANATNKPA